MEGGIPAPLFSVQFSLVYSGIGRDTGAVCAGLTRGTSDIRPYFFFGGLREPCWYSENKDPR